MSDIINILLAVVLLIIIISFGLITYYLIQALRSVKKLTETTEVSVENFKNSMQARVLTIIPSVIVALLSRIIRRR